MAHPRPTPRRIAHAALAAATAAVLGGCADGRSDEPLTRAAAAAPQRVAAAPAVAAPAPRPPADAAIATIGSGAGGTAAAPAASTAADAAASTAADAVAARAHRRAQRARLALREERKRAKAREKRLRSRLATARRQRAERASSQKAPAPQISASDVGAPAPVTEDPDVLSARSQVIAFHRLLDRRAPSACDLMTPRLLADRYGPGDAAGRCRAAVETIDARVRGRVLAAAARDGIVHVRVRSQMGAYARVQDIDLVLVGGTWRIDALRPVAAG